MFFYRKRSRGGTEVYAISGTKVAPSSGTKVAPSSRAKVSSTSGAKVSSTSGTQVSPTSGAKVSPTSGTQVSPTSGAKVSSTSGTQVSPTSGTQVSPTSGAKVSSTSGTQVSPTSGTQVSPTSGAKVSSTRGTQVSPTSGTQVSPTSGAKVSPTSGTKVSSTSPGSSGMGARRPNFRKEDMNAIHRAASKNKMMKMLLLLNFEFSDVYERDKKGRTALHVACAYGHASMVKLLINRPLLNLLDNEKKTALIHAVQYQNMECATLLLKHGADPNIKDNDGNTALHYAVLGHNKAIAEKLLSCKANIEVRNKSDLTPLALAKLANNEKMVELLVSRGAKDDQSKQQLTSEEKGPQKSESHTPVTDQQETRKQAWTETKSMTVVDISDEDSLSSHQKITSEYKEEKGPRKFESYTPVTELRKTQKEAWTKTKSMTVIEVSEEDSLSSKQQLTSEYKKEKEPKKSESCTPVIELQETQKEAWTKTKSMTVTDVSEEDSLSSKQPLTSTGKYKEKRGPQKSEGCTPDLRKTQKHARTETKSRTVVDTSEEDSFSSKQQLTSKYKEKRRTQKRRPQKRSTLDLQKTQKQAWTETKSRTVIHVSEEDSLNRLCSKPGIDDVSKPTSHNEDVKVEEEKKKQGSSKRKVSGNMYNAADDDSDGWSQKSTGEHTHKQQLPVMKSGDSDRICSKPGIDDDSKPTSYNEDLKEKVISETHTGIAKTSKNQSKRIHLSPSHLKKTTQESQIKRASDKEDTSAYSGHPSVQKDEEMCIKQGTLEQRKNLQLFKDESKQKSHEFSVKLKMTECPEEEPPRDNSKGGASLRQMPSNLTSKMLDCEGKGAFGMSVSAALQTFPGRNVPTFKIVPPSHADPGSAEDSSWSSSSELSLKEKELHSENDHKPDAEHILNKNEESFYNDIESKNVRTPAVTSEVREDQEFAMQMTKNMNPNTTERKLGIGPTPQSSDPKSHLDLWLVGFNETKQMIERKSHDMSAVTNTYQETKPNQHLFQKPLGADRCSANYFQSMDSRVKDESSSALHNDRTPGAHVTEELQQDLQRRTNDIDMVKVERPAWKKEIVHLQKEVEEEKKKQGSSRRKVSGNMYNAAADDSDEWSQKSTGEHTHKQQLPVMKSGDSDRICSKPGIDDDSKPTSYNEDLKEKVISETHTGIAKTSKNQSKRIHLSPSHLKKTTQESQIKRASDKEDTSAYSGHPSVQKDEEMCIKQGTLEQRKNLQLFKDESKQKPHEFSVKLKMTECPEEEPPRDNSKGGASLRQMPSNLTSKMLDCEGKDAFGMSVSAALQTFPGRKVPTFKIVPPSHADPGSAEDSSWSSSSELSLKEKELHSENDHKPDAEHILNKNEESFYNDIESKNVRTPAVTSEVREDQEFAMQMTKNMNPNTTERKLGIGPTPQSSDPKSHLDLWLVGFNETKQMIERKSHDMSAVTNTYQETKPNQHLFQKPLGADRCSANYFQSMDSRVKDESSSALHNDRTPGAHVTEELQQDLQRRTNDIDMVKVERPAWKKEIVHLQKEVEEEKKKQGSSRRKVSGNMYNAAADDSDEWSQKSTGEHTHKQQLPVMKSRDSDRICSKPGIDDDSKPTSYNEDLKEKVISETHTGIAKTSKNQSKRIHLSPSHLKKTTQESQIKRASDKEDTSAYSGHPSVQKDEEMCIKQGTLEQRKNLQLFKDESKQKPHEFSVKLKMTECPEEEPPRDNSKGGASLRQMPSNLTSKMLDCEGKDAFGMSVSAALQTFPGRKVPTFKIVPPSHADPGSAEDSSWSSSSELSLKEKELHSENDHKPDAEHILNKNEESFYNDIESKNVRTPAVTSEVREDQEFAMQMTKNMNPNTTERKLGIGPTPQSSDPKSHLDLWLVGFNETKQMIERKSHDMSAVTNTYQETKPNQHLFQKPLGADRCSANYFQSMDSRVKDESSSALHNDRTPGAHVTEELQQDLQRRTNDIDMVKVERPAWKKEIVHLQKEVEEEKKKQGSSRRKVSGNMYNAAADDSDEWSQKSTGEHTHKQQLPVMKSGDSDRICSKPGIDDDSKPTSYNEDLKEKVISETHTGIAKTSKNQSKRIHLSPSHLKKTTQESQIKRASDKEDTSAYSGHPSVQKDEEMCIKQGTLEQRKNLQLFKDESKQKPHEFSVKLKMTECPEEEPPRDNSKGGASLRQMPSNLTSKMLDCEGKDAFGMSVSAALQTFPGRKVPTFKIVPPSHADPGSAEDSSWSSSSELSLKEKELHSENDHKPDAEHILNKNEESFYNDIESKNVRTPAVTSEVREDQEFAMQMTKNMNPNTTERKLGIGPTPQSSDPKSHLDLWLVGFNETKQMIERKSHDMSAVTNTYQETKPNQHLFQKPLGADRCSANYFQSMDSRVKDESSSALHNDRTPGAHVTEELQQDLQRRTNDIDMVKVERPAWKKEIVHLQKEVEEEKKKQGSSKRKVSGNMYNAAADDSDGWSQKSTGEHTHKQQLPVMKSGDSDRFPLREEKEKRRKADLLCEKNRVQLRKKEEHSIKEVEMNPQLETTIRTQDITLEIIRENEVIEERNYTKRQPSSEQTTRILQDGILTKHFCKPKVIEIAHKKINSEVSESSDKEESLLHENRMLWDEIAKLRLEIDAVKIQTQEMGKKYIEDIAIVKEKNDCLEKTIRKTVFQHNAQLDVLKAELIMLNCKLENEQQNRGRLEAEVESYQSRLATAVQDHEHCQTSKRDLQLAFQRARDEWFCVWHKMNFDMSILKQNNEILSQQLSKAESKINNLEIELHHIRDALKERTLVLERELSQKQCQKEETEHVYQEEQGKVDEDIGKQESLQEKLSHLQRENKLLRQKLDQAHNKADRKENTAINIQDQIQDKISIFNADSVKQMLKLKESISELINEWHHFNERIHQYENDNVEIDATARQFQQELADTKKKLSTIEVFLEIESRHHMHLEDKKQDFKSKPGQSRSQNDELITKLQPASSKCVRLDEEKTPQQELSVEALLKKREELKAKIEKWKRRAVKLETDMKMHMAEGCVGEKYKLKIEEATKGLADKVAQLNLFLQTQRASQETSEQLKCMHSASIRSHLELGNPLFASFSR